ncbi:MAG: hypothetical protein KJ077_08500 [Anaerolineae bacterium]|nr:hypothetical protein [Anaerolineae bacterium]
MVKARGQVTRSTTPKRAYAQIGEPTVEIAAWCPDPDAKMPPEQVHFIMHLPGLEELPLIMRFKSPDTLGFFIEELARYRKAVWPEAEQVNVGE